MPKHSHVLSRSTYERQVPGNESEAFVGSTRPLPVIEEASESLRQRRTLAGHAIEKHERWETVYDVTVLMNGGTLRTVRQSTSPVMGEKVRVDADGLHNCA